MSSLDTLARSASEAVHESVADLPVPVATVGAAAGATATWRMFRYAVAGAAAGFAVIAVLLIAPSPEDDVPADTTLPPTTEVTQTTVAETPDTTVAEPESTETPVSTTIAPAAANEEPAEETPVVDATPPHLAVLSPSDGEHLGSSKVTFTGTTEAGAHVIASGKFPAQVWPDGSWTIDLLLAPGANGVVFEATDEAGNEAEIRMTVYYDAPEPKETTTTVAAWDFTANQKYGSCAEPVPYDEFSGYAKPGSTVTVTSEFGGGSTTADAEGNWWVRVEFPSAPTGETFKVKAKDAFGTVRTFNFVSNYEG